MQDCLDTLITTIPRLTPDLEKKLARISVVTYRDAIFHWPLRYENHCQLIPVATIMDGTKGLFEGIVTQVRIHPRGATVFLESKRALLRLVFFQKCPVRRPVWTEGQLWRCFGEIRLDAQGYFLSHPQYWIFDSESPPPLVSTLTPVYPTTPGLSQTILRRVIQEACDRSQSALQQTDGWIEKDLWSLMRALRFVHAPSPDVTLVEGCIPFTHPAWRRLITEELCAYYIAMQKTKTNRQEAMAPALLQKTMALLPHLSFTLTGAQMRAAEAIAEDLTKSQPMMRLLQGDVGSGKTAVAAMAAVQAVHNGVQVAIMAPTEMLALQHVQTFQRWLGPMGITMAGLISKTPLRVRAKIRETLANGTLSVLIGTHAIFQSDQVFSNLGLVVIDEQHRFGVAQRLALCNKAGEGVHQLVMSATPIPRTLAMAYYADLDISILDELPPGRQPIQTLVLPERRREEVVMRIAAMCLEGGQAYWVCPLVEESENIRAQCAEKTQEALAQLLPQLRVGLLHGKMKSAEKQSISANFRAREIDVLVATTVIEVGIDVPNARIIVLENGERLGLAQAHQLRGRVGRGVDQSYCIVLYGAALSTLAQARLRVLKDTQDGFVIAEQDLQLRGPGEILGLRQTGFKPFRVADWGRDRALLPSVIALSKQLQEKHPDTAAHWMARWYRDAPVFSEV